MQSVHSNLRVHNNPESDPTCVTLVELQIGMVMSSSTCQMVQAAEEYHNDGQQKVDSIAIVPTSVGSTVLIDGGLGSYIVGMGCVALR